MIVIVDYGMGNLGSIRNMLKKLGVPARLSSLAEDIRAADKLILPGVGAFDRGMAQIHKGGLLSALNECALERKIPILGICLGMQLLMERSEEGTLPGLGWIEGEVVRFRFDGDASRLKVPHMGWNEVELTGCPLLFTGLTNGARFYFVHSYHVSTSIDPSNVLAVARHGYRFPAAIRKGNVMGTQFHPEKSHRFGMQLLKNFAEGSC